MSILAEIKKLIKKSQETTEFSFFKVFKFLGKKKFKIFINMKDISSKVKNINKFL